jgi:predicted CXXCH cytochrome family protein
VLVRHLGWLLFVFVASCRRAPPPLPTSLDCGACHRAAVEALGSSHHAAGQQLATPKTVPAGRVGGFVITHLDGGVVISWDGGSGAAHFTIGVEPLAQVAVEVDGRLQVPPIGWQRDGGWLQVPVPPGASFDWRGPQFSWNGSCAPCHATGFRVGVTEDAGFESSWSSLAVGCRACHGDEAGHRRWLEAGRPDGGVGFAFSLRQTATFELADGGSIATGRGAGPDVQTNVCGACHARRRLLRDDGVVRADLLDRAELSLRAPGLYTPTGEVLDEVYEVGSFLMSRMERAGVRCSDCHEPHRGALRAEGNALCARCHRPEVFDRPSHHRHQHVACVDCHMPPTTFLGVDVRHDHSIQRPSRAVCERCQIGRAHV